jgi:hypothetical protein
MPTLFDRDAATSIKTRLDAIRPDSPRQWGKMQPAQMLAHCAGALEEALGDSRPPRMLIGYVLGWAIKRIALSDKPMGRNAPTTPDGVIADDRDLEAERRRLHAAIDRFVHGGDSACTTHPHAFFGRLTPHEWAFMQHKHLDHHLRQFGA